MPDLLLELFSEEIPARMQEDAAGNLARLLKNHLGEFTSDYTVFSTPRRIAVWAKNLPEKQPDVSTELKGPKVGAPEQALAGFLRKNNLQQKDLIERDGVYFANIHQKGRSTIELAKDAIEAVLIQLPWPKSMRWGSGEQAWVRPLHSILCIFDGKVVPVEFAGVKAGNVTYGHRFLSPKPITVKKPEEYEAALEKAHVIADREKRKAEILKQAEALAAKKGLQLKKDAGLLEEVTGLVEWPVVLAGNIDKNFMDLPPEVLVSEMRAHQKYFALVNKNGQLSDTFLITANMETKDGGKAIIAGNERVLKARLADGRFFWDQDRKKLLNEWAKGLTSVTFHARLGSIADKVERIKTLALQLADITKADKKLVERAAALCKADLTTGMVGEFPELQGVMGRYYALEQNESPEVADAIRDHYRPQGPNDSVPGAAVSICVALADKLDTLVSMFAIGEKPTGSKDPYASRRAALGVIRIILENNIRLPLKACFAAAPVRAIALADAQAQLVKKTEARLAAGAHRVGKYLTVNESASEDLEDAVPPNLSAMLYDFFADRLKVQLKDQGIRHDVIAAVMANGDDDLWRVVERAKALQAFLATDDGANLLVAYRRAANILGIEEKKDKKTYNGILPSDAPMRSIEVALNKATGEVERYIREEKFEEAMNSLADLRKPVDEFFEGTLINDADAKMREGNLNVLAQIRRNFNWVADFSVVEGNA